MLKRRLNFSPIGLALCVTLIGVSACTPTVRFHGYVPPADELEQIVVGVDTRGSVADVVGEPLSSGIMAEGGWYYIQTKVRHFAYQEAKVVERSMVAISFDADEVVTNIEQFSLEDGRVIPIARRVTEKPVKGPGFWQQLLGTIGNIDPAGILAGRN